MEINYHANSRNVQHFMCEALGAAGERFLNKVDHAGNLDITISVGGKEIDAVDFINKLYPLFEEAAKKAAIADLRETISGNKVLDKLQRAFFDIEWRIDEALEDALPGWRASSVSC